MFFFRCQFSTWEKELHKIVFDPRYLLLNLEEQQVVEARLTGLRDEAELMLRPEVSVDEGCLVSLLCLWGSCEVEC